MSLRLSPSEYHQHILSQTIPELGFKGGSVKVWQGKLRRKLKQLVGELPKKPCALKPKLLWRKKHPLGVIEKISFTSEPFSDVVAYVCLPKSVKPPYNFVICLQGHSTGMHNSIRVQRDNENKSHPVEGDRDFGLICMQNGMAALCIEQRSFGLRREQKQKHISSHGCHDASMHALLLGKTLLGERVYDVDRGIDYLATRKDVAMKNIGVMGNSGGGTISLFAAALLPRIAFAMPSCYFCTFKDSLMSIYHCMDNYIPGLIKFAEISDIAGLIAPKPLVLVSGLTDDIFPIKATRRAFKDLQKIYTAAGVKNNCQLVVGSEGHRFYADDAWPVLLKILRDKG